MNGISRVSTWMCDAIVSILHSVSLDVRRDYVQDERYIAGEHMDVRRDCVSLAQRHFFGMAAKAV